MSSWNNFENENAKRVTIQQQENIWFHSVNQLDTQSPWKLQGNWCKGSSKQEDWTSQRSYIKRLGGARKKYPGVMIFSLEVWGFFLLFSLSTIFPQQAHLQVGGAQTNPGSWLFSTLLSHSSKKCVYPGEIRWLMSLGSYKHQLARMQRWEGAPLSFTTSLSQPGACAIRPSQSCPRDPCSVF